MLFPKSKKKVEKELEKNLIFYEAEFEKLSTKEDPECEDLLSIISIGEKIIEIKDRLKGLQKDKNQGVDYE